MTEKMINFFRITGMPVYPPLSREKCWTKVEYPCKQVCSESH